MRHGLTVARVFAGLAMAVGFLAILGTEPAGASHVTKARITIHKLVCPENTARLFDQCHDNRLAGVPFTVKGQTKLIESNGEEVWRRSPGRTPITEDATTFAKYRGAYVYCSELKSGAVLFDGRISTNSITLTTWSGANIVCDWYNLTRAQPKGADVSVHVLKCPATTRDVFGACHNSRLKHVPFTIGGVAANSGSDGLAAAHVAAGKVAITEDAATFNQYGRAFVFCSSAGKEGTGDVFIGTTTSRTITANLPDGAKVHCDWYNLT